MRISCNFPIFIAYIQVLKAHPFLQGLGEASPAVRGLEAAHGIGAAVRGDVDRDQGRAQCGQQELLRPAVETGPLGTWWKKDGSTMVGPKKKLGFLGTYYIYI